MEANEIREKAFFKNFEPLLLQELAQHALSYAFEEEEVLIDIAQTVLFVPLVLDGYVKIVREDKTDGEHLLYFLESGSLCTLSIGCCLDDKKSEIKAVAESKGKLVKIPLQKMDEWMARFPSWRNFVLQSYNQRLQEMLQAIDGLAFLNLEDRILKYLADKKERSNSRFVETTHQQIAIDLNTSRVVVSRILKKLEQQNKININRKNIEYLGV